MISVRTIADEVGVTRQSAERWINKRLDQLPKPSRTIEYTLEEHGFARTYRFWSEDQGDEIIARYIAERKERS